MRSVSYIAIKLGTQQWAVYPKKKKKFLPADFIFYKDFTVGTFDITNVAIRRKMKRKINLSMKQPTLMYLWEIFVKNYWPCHHLRVYNIG